MLPALVLAASLAEAAPRADAVTWTVGPTTFSGWVVWDDATATKRPGVVMVPNWMGVSPSAVEKARGIAGTKYVVLVADMYGKDVRPKDKDEAKKAAGAVYADRTAMRARAAAAVGALEGQAGKVPVDTTKIGAIGFCFGGSSVLELARSGAAVDGVVSFHGGLATESPAAAGAVKAPVLVLNGAADPNVPEADVDAFEAEMTKAGADWQLVQLGGAVHCFTEPSDNSPGCMYDKKAADRAYAMMGDFFDEVFAR